MLSSYHRWFILLVPFWGRQSLNTNRGGALCTGADGLRLGVKLSATWNRSLGFLPNGRTVRACAGGGEGRRRRLDLAPGRDPVGEERS
jgi:hypothetical protein